MLCRVFGDKELEVGSEGDRSKVVMVRMDGMSSKYCGRARAAL